MNGFLGAGKGINSVSMRIEMNNLMREDNRVKFKLPVSIPGYCPKCHLFNHLPRKSEDGEDICISCWQKENE